MSNDHGSTPALDEQSLHAVIAAAPSGVLVIGPDQTFRAWNAAAEEITGWPAEQVIGRRDPTVAEAHRPRAEELLAEWLEHPERA